MLVTRSVVLAAVLSLLACTDGTGEGSTELDVLREPGNVPEPMSTVQGAGGTSSSAMGGAQAPAAGGSGGVNGAAGVAGDMQTAGAGGAAGSAANADGGIGTDASEPEQAAGPGMSQLLTVEGKPVTVYLPALRSDNAPVPVVFSLHGMSIPSAAMADITGLPAVADRENFIAVFPEGTGGTWNTQGASCGLGSFASGAADDAAYLQAILDAVEALRPIDRERVFLSGFSMGGYASNALGCKHPELFRAIAPAAGGMPAAPCAAEIRPVILFHGTSDGTIAYDCGVQARNTWAQHNGCSAEVDSVPVMGGTCEWNQGCPPGGQVVLCSYQGMGHGWAGSSNLFALGGTQFESATTLMWEFFEDAL